MADDSASKVGKAKPKRPEKLSQKEQSARFIETARELDADESGTAFERAVGVVLNPKS